MKTIGDLARLPPDLLLRRFGSMGPVLDDRARGIDPTPVGDGEAAKSVSHEHTFDRDTNDWEVIERTLLALSEGVAGRLRAGGVRPARSASRSATLASTRTPASGPCPSRPTRPMPSGTRPWSWPDPRCAASRCGCWAWRPRIWRSGSSCRCSGGSMTAGAEAAPGAWMRSGSGTAQGDHPGAAAREQRRGAVRARPPPRPGGPPRGPRLGRPSRRDQGRRVQLTARTVRPS